MHGAPGNEILMMMVNILMMLLFKSMTHNQNDRVTPQNKECLEVRFHVKGRKSFINLSISIIEEAVVSPPGIVSAGRG